MSRQKLRVINTQLDNLVANLRAEVGEVITTWVIARRSMAQESHRSSGDIAKDMVNQVNGHAGIDVWRTEPYATIVGRENSLHRLSAERRATVPLKARWGPGHIYFQARLRHNA